MASSFNQPLASNYLNKYSGYYRGHSLNPNGARGYFGHQYQKSEVGPSNDKYIDYGYTNNLGQTIDVQNAKERLIDNNGIFTKLEHTQTSSYFRNSDIVYSAQPSAIQLTNFNLNYNPTNKGT